MQVAHGLLRLWVVVAALWLFGIGAATWYTLPPPDDWAAVRGLPVPTERANLPDAPLPASRPAHILEGIGVAFVPPILVLVIGAAFGWAARGFR